MTPELAADTVEHSCASVSLALRRATSVEDLQLAARRIDELVPLLHARGTAVEHIAGQVCELNAQVFAQLWFLLAPAGVAQRSCLVVMGSEGRGEQIFKTDQDNALLLRNGDDVQQAQAVARDFTEALTACGYPQCPGGIMLSNPLWRQPVADFKQTLVSWIFGSDPNGPMRLAIFLDAVAVAGDAGLLEQARAFVQDHVVDHDAFFARFARAADQFDLPSGWWQRLRAAVARQELAFDLKKAAIFPLVHGVRALALQRRVAEVRTVDRLRVLAARGHLPEATAAALAAALHALMVLKLENNLRQRARAEPMHNLLRLSDLDAERRTSLQDCLAVVGRFRHYLREHFRLDAL